MANSPFMLGIYPHCSPENFIIAHYTDIKHHPETMVWDHFGSAKKLGDGINRESQGIIVRLFVIRAHEHIWPGGYTNLLQCGWKTYDSSWHHILLLYPTILHDSFLKLSSPPFRCFSLLLLGPPDQRAARERQVGMQAFQPGFMAGCWGNLNMDHFNYLQKLYRKEF